MPHQNRVLPTAEIVALPARGTFMGNRGGAFHDAEQRLGRARWRSRRLICCLLCFKNRRRHVMAPGRYTELFFLDEAVALAAGHRPCAECRRPAYAAFLAAWAHATSTAPRADDLDRVLHAARLSHGRVQRRVPARLDTMPWGAFVLHDGDACLVRGDALLPFGPEGYGPPVPRPSGLVAVLTLRPTLAALASGYAPILHPSAG